MISSQMHISLIKVVEFGVTANFLIAESKEVHILFCS